MNRSMSSAAALPKGNLDVLADGSEDNSLVRTLLRAAITESGWKDGAVAESMGLTGASGAAYFSKMLSGEKPISAKHLRALPDDVEAIFARLYAESFGLIVVAPARGDEAVKQLVAGLFGVLAPQLPARAGRFAKAGLR